MPSAGRRPGADADPRSGVDAGSGGGADGDPQSGADTDAPARPDAGSRSGAESVAAPGGRDGTVGGSGGGPDAGEAPLDPHAPNAADGPTIRLSAAGLMSRDDSGGSAADAAPGVSGEREPVAEADEPTVITRPVAPDDEATTLLTPPPAADAAPVAVDDEPTVPAAEPRSLDGGATMRLQPPFFAPGTTKAPRSVSASDGPMTGQDPAETTEQDGVAGGRSATDRRSGEAQPADASAAADPPTGAAVDPAHRDSDIDSEPWEDGVAWTTASAGVAPAEADPPRTGASRVDDDTSQRGPDEPGSAEDEVSHRWSEDHGSTDHDTPGVWREESGGEDDSRQARWDEPGGTDNRSQQWHGEPDGWSGDSAQQWPVGADHTTPHAWPDETIDDPRGRWDSEPHDPASRAWPDEPVHTADASQRWPDEPGSTNDNAADRWLSESGGAADGRWSDLAAEDNSAGRRQDSHAHEPADERTAGDDAAGHSQDDVARAAAATDARDEVDRDATPAASTDDGAGAAAVPDKAAPGRRFSSAGALIWVLLALLGFTLVVQLQSNDDDAGLASARQEDLVGILSDLEARDQRLQQEINALEESQRQLTSGVAGRQAALAEAGKRAEELGLLSGTLPARGPGLKISIDPKGQPIKASAILNAVQELRGAGGEVMEIIGDNGVAVRIVASSYFVDADGGQVIVDGKQLSGPYTLWVIGVPSTMQTALQIPGGVVASVSQAGGNVTMEQRTAVEVAAVRQPTSLQYARPVS
jgi:uncharacterized protein YlxW (UPF0749 family)